MGLEKIEHHCIDEKITDHSTICKTRQRIPQEVFDDVFKYAIENSLDST